MSGWAVASTVLVFAAIVGVGATLRATGLLGPADSRVLNTVIVYVGLPAFIFQAVHGVRLSRELLGVVGVAWAVMAVSFVVAYAAGRVIRADGPRMGAVLLASSLGNTGYLGYPLTAAIMGAAAVPVAVFSDVFGTVFALVLVGLPVAARLGVHDEQHPSVVRELLTFPAVIALVAALALRSVEIPVLVSDGLDLLARLVAPLIMISVGLSLRPRSLAALALPLSVVGGIKLVLAPLVALTIAPLILHDAAVRVAVLEAGMPTMMLTLVVGERFGLDSELIAAAIFVTTIVSALTIAGFQTLAL